MPYQYDMNITASSFLFIGILFSFSLLSIFKKRPASHCLDLHIIIISFLKVWAEAMEKSNTKLPNPNPSKTNKLLAATSKSKKQPRQSSSKNLKLLKSAGSKGHLNHQQPRIKQQTSPNSINRTQIQNDYGVNTYYAKYKVKTSKKKEQEEQCESTDYGNFSNSKDTERVQQENRVEKGSEDGSQSDYVSSAFQKLKLPNQRGLINAQGKFVNNKKETSTHKYSFREQSTSKHSFSLNFTNKEEGSRKKVNRSKQKTTISNKSLNYKIRYKSSERNIAHSYYEKRKSYSKKKKTAAQRKEIVKIAGINSNSVTEAVSSCQKCIKFVVNEQFMSEVRDQISRQLQASKGTIRKQRISESQLRQRARCVHLLAKISNALSIKREGFFLAIYYMDQYISQYSAPNMKILALGALTLALKMDDAEMTSKFCFQYLYNPEKTVKRNSSGQQLRLKQKQKEMKEVEDPRQIKSKLAAILATKICQQKKAREDYSLDEILDFETHIMVKLNFRLAVKTTNYWIDTFTTLWDGFLNEEKPQHFQVMQFRSQLQGKNWSYLHELIEIQLSSMTIYSYSKISIVLGGLYLVSRMALQQKKEETPWEQLCRYYRASLAKSTNIIFCDGVGINPLFGDFLNLFQLNISSIVDCIQLLSRNLHPQSIKLIDLSKAQGKNREDKLATYHYNQQLYRLAER